MRVHEKIAEIHLGEGEREREGAYSLLQPEKSGLQWGNFPGSRFPAPGFYLHPCVRE